MKEEPKFPIPDKSSEVADSSSLGQEPAVNLMREKLAGVYPTPTKDPNQPSDSHQVGSQPEPLDPNAGAVHGQVEKLESKPRSSEDVKRDLLNKVRGGNNSKRSRLKPFLIALATGIIYLGVSYNEVAIAQVKQYLAPGSNLTTPVIVDPTENISVGKESRIIIPKINVDVPVVYDVKTFDEQAIQNGLERGVVHYGTTAVPGQTGNNVIVGHSSNNFFNSGRYKFAFVLLGKLEVGDTFILHYGGERYIYKVSVKRVIEPDDFSLIQPTNVPTTTLITCTPPGTSWQRLVIQGEQISPAPTGDEQKAGETVENLDTTDIVVPGNAPSFWSNIFNIFD